MSSSDPSSPEEPRLIIDEDWKAQVEREKAAQRQGADAPHDSTGAATPEAPHLPPANLSGIVSMFASQAMAAMGLLPDPLTGEASTNRPLAKFLIDTLGVLEQKTEGNRSAEESRELTDALHHLRMIYVATPPAKQTSADRQPRPASTLELPH